MSKFVPRHTYEEKPDASLAKNEAVKVLSKGRGWPGEAELGIKGRVDHPSTDGEVQNRRRLGEFKTKQLHPSPHGWHRLGSGEFGLGGPEDDEPHTQGDRGSISPSQH